MFYIYKYLHLTTVKTTINNYYLTLNYYYFCFNWHLINNDTTTNYNSSNNKNNNYHHTSEGIMNFRLCKYKGTLTELCDASSKDMSLSEFLSRSS